MQFDNSKDIKKVGSIVRVTSKSYLDQIDGFTVVSSKKIESYLMSKYGLTVPEYYNLIVYGSKDLCPRCMSSTCNNPSRFLGLTVGYQRYCSDECKKHSILRDYVNKIPWTDQRRKEKSELNRKIQMDKVVNGTHNFLYQTDEHKFNAQLESGKFTFIKRAELRGITEGMLYYGLIDDNNFKIGITFVSIESRAYYHGLKTIHLLIRDSVEKVAEIEYQIKLKFKDYSTYTHESFPISKFREILSEIKDLL